MKLGKFVIAGAIIGLSIADYLHVTHRIQADRDAPVAAQVTPTPAYSPTPTPSGSPTVAGQGSVKISLYHVTITVVDPITDLVFGEVPFGSGTAAGFTTESLLAKYPECKAGALGSLVRVKSSPPPTPSSTPTPKSSFTPYPTRTPSGRPFSKYVDGYTYSYRSPAFTCATDQAGLNAVAQAKAQLVNGALPTITGYKP